VTPLRPLFVPAGAGAGSAWLSIEADAAATGGAIGLVEAVIARSSPHLRVHRNEDEAFYALEGAL
jgi:hypothetical protein